MSDKLNAIIIDDESLARITLEHLLTEFCPTIQIVDRCATVPEGVIAINKHHPQLVFLDIEMPIYDGFQLLNFFKTIEFEIIFVTAYSDYALKAFEVSAIDYLVKPVEIEALQRAVQKATTQHKFQTMNKRLELMNNHFKDDQQKKIAITTNQGTHFIDIDEIVLFEADGSYTSIYLKEGSKLVVSKKLKYFEDLLSANNAFFRTHRSHIIQFNHISIYNKGMGEIVMNNKRVASLSRERKNEFEERLNENGLN